MTACSGVILVVILTFVMYGDSEYAEETEKGAPTEDLRL